MAAPNGRGKQSDRNQNCQCNVEDVSRRLGSAQTKSFSVGNDSDSIFYPNSAGRDKTGTWTVNGGQETPGGIYRRLKILQKAWLQLVESQQQQLENSLRESKQLTAEMQNLQALLAETLDDIPEE